MDIIKAMGFFLFDMDEEDFHERDFFDRVIPYDQRMPMNQKALVIRRSPSMNLVGGAGLEETVKHQAFVVAVVALRWLREEGIKGRVKFWFLVRIQNLDVDIECAVVQK